MSRKTSLCLLTFNELPGCERDVPRLPLDGFHEVFCVDGGSSDGTAEFMKGRGIPVHRQPRRGLNAAYVHAAERATGDALVVFFPKGTLPVEIVGQIRRTLDDGYDFVATSRNMAGGRNEEDAAWFRPRKWFVSWLGLFVALLWRRAGPRFTDVLHGIKGYSKDAFLRMHIEDSGHAVDLAMAIRAYRMRLRVTEIPAVESPRFYGDTHFKALAGGSHLLGFLAREVLGLNPGQAA